MKCPDSVQHRVKEKFGWNFFIDWIPEQECWGLFEDKGIKREADVTGDEQSLPLSAWSERAGREIILKLCIPPDYGELTPGLVDHIRSEDPTTMRKRFLVQKEIKEQAKQEYKERVMYDGLDRFYTSKRYSIVKPAKPKLIIP